MSNIDQKDQIHKTPQKSKTNNKNNEDSYILRSIQKKPSDELTGGIQTHYSAPIKDIDCQALYSESDENEYSQNQDHGVPHMDRSFNYSFFRLNAPAEFNPETDTLRWFSIQEILSKTQDRERADAKISPEGLKNADLGVGYLAALSLLSSRPEFLERLLATSDEEYKLTRGFRVKLCIGGIWTEYLIDDFVPVWLKDTSEGKTEEKLIVEKTKFLYINPLESGVWAALLEKAYAKAYGGYDRIQGVSFEEAFKDFSGVPVENFTLWDSVGQIEESGVASEGDGDSAEEAGEYRFFGVNQNLMKFDQLWEEIGKRLKAGDLVTACFNPDYEGVSQSAGSQANIGAKGSSKGSGVGQGSTPQLGAPEQKNKEEGGVNNAPVNKIHKKSSENILLKDRGLQSKVQYKIMELKNRSQSAKAIKNGENSENRQVLVQDPGLTIEPQKAIRRPLEVSGGVGSEPRLQQSSSKESKGQFWIDFSELTKLFNEIKFSVPRPEFEHNSLQVPLTNNTQNQSTVKIEITDPGTYHISLDQKPRAMYTKGTYSYAKCCLTLGRILDGTIKYIKHILTTSTQTTSLNFPELEAGVYVLLIDLEFSPTNLHTEQKYPRDNELLYWRDVVVNIAGSHPCLLSGLQMDPNKQMIYDYFIHRIWRDYSQKLKPGDGSGSKQLQVEVHEPNANLKDTLGGDSIAGTTLPSRKADSSKIDIIVQLIELDHLSLYKLYNLSKLHIQVAKFLKEKLPEGLECFSPFEVNNEDPWAVIGAGNDQILVFKLTNKLETPPPIQLNEEFEVIATKAPNTEEYYGEDPFDFMLKLHNVQPGRVAPLVNFRVPEEGLLINNADLKAKLDRAQALKNFEEEEGMSFLRKDYPSPEVTLNEDEDKEDQGIREYFGGVAEGGAAGDSSNVDISKEMIYDSPRRGVQDGDAVEGDLGKSSISDVSPFEVKDQLDPIGQNEGKKGGNDGNVDPGHGRGQASTQPATSGLQNSGVVNVQPRRGSKKEVGKEDPGDNEKQVVKEEEPAEEEGKGDDPVAVKSDDEPQVVSVIVSDFGTSPRKRGSSGKMLNSEKKKRGYTMSFGGDITGSPSDPVSVPEGRGSNRDPASGRRPEIPEEDPKEIKEEEPIKTDKKDQQNPRTQEPIKKEEKSQTATPTPKLPSGNQSANKAQTQTGKVHTKPIILKLDQNSPPKKQDPTKAVNFGRDRINPFFDNPNSNKNNQNLDKPQTNKIITPQVPPLKSLDESGVSDPQRSQTSLNPSNQDRETKDKRSRTKYQIGRRRRSRRNTNEASKSPVTPTKSNPKSVLSKTSSLKKNPKHGLNRRRDKSVDSSATPKTKKSVRFKENLVEPIGTPRNLQLLPPPPPPFVTPILDTPPLVITPQRQPFFPKQEILLQPKVIIDGTPHNNGGIPVVRSRTPILRRSKSPLRAGIPGPSRLPAGFTHIVAPAHSPGHSPAKGTRIYQTVVPRSPKVTKRSINIGRIGQTVLPAPGPLPSLQSSQIGQIGGGGAAVISPKRLTSKERTLVGRTAPPKLLTPMTPSRIVHYSPSRGSVGTNGKHPYVSIVHHLTPGRVTTTTTIGDAGNPNPVSEIQNMSSALPATIVNGLKRQHPANLRPRPLAGTSRSPELIRNLSKERLGKVQKRQLYIPPPLYSFQHQQERQSKQFDNRYGNGAPQLPGTNQRFVPGVPGSQQHHQNLPGMGVNGQRSPQIQTSSKSPGLRRGRVERLGHSPHIQRYRSPGKVNNHPDGYRSPGLARNVNMSGSKIQDVHSANKAVNPGGVRARAVRRVESSVIRLQGGQSAQKQGLKPVVNDGQNRRGFGYERPPVDVNGLLQSPSRLRSPGNLQNQRRYVQSTRRALNFNMGNYY